MIARGTKGISPRSVAWAGTLFAALCLAFFAVFPLTAHAVTEAHIFDPVLSLTGGCSTDDADTVADPWCPGPPGPSAPFDNPNITIDSYGNMYVSSHGDEWENGRVDVFSPKGQFITEFAVKGATDLGIDANGHLYVFQYAGNSFSQISWYSPTVYKPAEGKIEYPNPGVVVVKQQTPGFCSEFGFLPSWAGLTVDPTTGRLFVSGSGCVGEWGSVEEGNKPLDLAIGQGELSLDSKGLAVDASRNRLFVSDSKGAPDTSFIQVFELKSPHKFLGIIDGSETPVGKFLSDAGSLTVDADEKTGHIFVSDLVGTNRVYEFGVGLSEEEEYVESYQHKFKYVGPGEIAVDNSPVSPNWGTLYVPSGGTVDHTYAFKYVAQGPPLVESTSFEGVTEQEAVLRATINPEGLETSYRFEFTSQQRFEEEEFAGATIVGEGALASGIVGEEVSAPVTGLEPGAAYRFRVVATNEEGEGKGEGRFRTYSSTPSVKCGDEALRSGPSAHLPDCRAYELVSPPDTNGRAPLGIGNTGVYFPTLQASPDGTRVTFRIEGGSLPGSKGSGAFNGENYLARRGSNGWGTEIAAPSGTEAIAPIPGSVSPDQEHSFWGGVVDSEGNPVSEGEAARYIRYPDGHSEFVGQGSLGTDPNVLANLITENGGHVIFTTIDNLSHTAVPLEEGAPPEGTTAVYDRTADGVTHVVSLLPGNVTPSAGQDASYVGASYDGKGIAFRIGETLYLRHNNEETYVVGSGVTFAGVAEGGGRIFYVEGGDLYAFDVISEEAIRFTDSGDVTPVNVAAEGDVAYFLSPSVLTTEENPNGAVAQVGKDNLYRSQEGAISFVATVTALDVDGEPLPDGQVVGLGQWTKSLASGRVGVETSRVTPDGSVFLFESRANLDSYDSDGFAQIYRYDSAGGSLECLSCNPTEAPASSDATLQSIALTMVEAPIDTHVRVPNLRPDGKRILFQSSEALAMADTDGVQDVYEWEAQGVGSCQTSGGCIYLISSGQSARDDHLFGASESGDDVFFLTSDLLVGQDKDETPSIYDARVNGGFPEPVTEDCDAESCRPPLLLPPPLPSPGMLPNPHSGNLPQGKKCAKGKRKVTRHGKTRCVKKHRKHQRKAGKKGGAGK